MISSEFINQIFSFLIISFQKLIANSGLSATCQYMGITRREEIMRCFRGWPNAGAEKSGETQDRCFSKSVWYTDYRNNSNSSPLYTTPFTI